MMVKIEVFQTDISVSVYLSSIHLQLKQLKQPCVLGGVVLEQVKRIVH